MELNKIYFESLNDPKLKEIMHMRPKAKNKAINIKFSDRSTFHKIARILYKVTRSFYVSTTFYFVPLFVLFNNFMFSTYEEHH